MGDERDRIGVVAGLSSSRSSAARRTLVALCLALACTTPETAHRSALPLDASSAARGERLFLGSCAGYCHSPAHGGRGDAPDLFDCRWLYGAADEAVFRSISEGVPNTDMRAFADLLSEVDRWILVAWMRSQSLCA